VFGTSYTNSTDTPIFVSISLSGFNSDLPRLQLTIDGILVAASDSGSGAGGITVSGIVPKNSTYTCTVFNQLGTVTWAELR
jgi:hypothetical protein